MFQNYTNISNFSYFLQIVLRQVLVTAALMLFTVITPSWACQNFRASTFPLNFMDDHGTSVSITKPPERVVSLVPGVTEMIFRIGAGDALVGITYHTTLPGEASKKPIVGGFFEPSLSAIHSLDPDIIFLSDMQSEVRTFFEGRKNSHGNPISLIELDTRSLAHGSDNMMLLGEIFSRKTEAMGIKKTTESNIGLIQKKIAQIKPANKKRVMRLMGRGKVMTPGNDSFQNELIRLSGGIPPDFGKTGAVVDVSKREWIDFNPQVLYGCGGDKALESIIFNEPGWKDVDAVRNRQIYYFPCELTCRAATHTGYFVQWLSASIYSNAFACKDKQILKDEVFARRQIPFKGPSYVKDIRIDESHILDFTNRTLVIEFDAPMQVVSTLEGERRGIKRVVNHYTPPQNWLIDHTHGIDKIKERICKAIDVEESSTSLMITGADMNNLAIKKESYRELDVYAFVTAGVRSNAMRMSKDMGTYYEPGTINIVIMASMPLSNRAMTRAIVTVTEAKTAALLDMDIRSSYENGSWRATGTGTDNVIVVQGREENATPLEFTGGHTKLGQLMARAVYNGVKEAIFKQNGLTANLNIFQRLKMRGISFYSLIGYEQCDCGRSRNDFVGAVEELLLTPSYEGFMEAALALSDDYEKGLVEDLSLFDGWCRSVAREISGKNTPIENDDLIQKFENIKFSPGSKDDNPETLRLPVVIKMAINALFNGIYNQTM